MKLALVVQRYGASVNGGAELHARYIAELLAKHHDVEALTTCASDYVTWRNELPAGTETLRGVTVRRFPVSRERDPRQFGHHSRHVFERKHSLADELSWLESEGPTSPAMIEYIRTHADDYDFWIFFSYRYYHAYHGARAVPHKAILVPTAERDAAVGLSLFGPLFRGVRAVMYNSHEERAMIRAATQNDAVPGVIVGVGSEVPRAVSAERFRQKYDVQGPFLIYVGRIDENKGCRELFQFFTGYRPSLGQRLQLLLIGNSILPIPNHPNIRHLGFVSDQDKFDAIAASEALAMPSYYESLSMVALEAWALGRPVLANGHCDVLRGQCIRSRAGLYYENLQEFCETLFTLTTHRQLNEALGENGRRFYEQHYAWPVIERKYLDMLKRLAAEPPATQMEALPGWLARRRRTLAPALSVLDTLPKGAAVAENEAAGVVSAASQASVPARVSQASAEPDRSGRAVATHAGYGAQLSDAGAGSSASAGSAAARGAGAGSGGTSAAGGASATSRDASGRDRSDRDRPDRDSAERDHAGRGAREGRDTRDRDRRGARDARGGREDRAASGGTKDAKETKDTREGRDRETRDARGPREDRPAREPREGRDSRERRGGGRGTRGDRETRGSDTREARERSEPGNTESSSDAPETRAAGDERPDRPRDGNDTRETRDARGPRGERRGRDRRGRDRDRDRRGARGQAGPGDGPAPADDSRDDARRGDASTGERSQGQPSAPDPRQDQRDQRRESDGETRASSRSSSSDRSPGDAPPQDAGDEGGAPGNRDEARRSSGRRGRGPRGRGRSGNRSGPGSSGSGSGGAGSSGSGSSGSGPGSGSGSQGGRS